MIPEETQHATFVAFCKTCAFLVNRYPYMCAILLMLSTSEKVKLVRSSSPNLTTVYAHLGMFFLAGTSMAFDIFKTARFFALVTAGQFGFRSYEIYMAGDLKDPILAKVLIRNLALIGCYLMVGGGIAEFGRNVLKNQRLIAFGKQLFGAYSFLNAVMIWNSDVEFRAHSTHLPGGVITTYGMMIMYIICGVLIYANYESEYFSKLLAWTVFVDTVFVDMDTKFWWIAAQVSRWMQLSIASQNLCAVAGLIVIRKER